MTRSFLRAAAMSGVLAFGGFLVSCSDSPTVPDDAPEGHTVVKDGVAHAQGLNDPLQNCTTCHGANLQGGSSGEPSCTGCHGVVWLSPTR